jgi:hypothetical protein
VSLGRRPRLSQIIGTTLEFVGPCKLVSPLMHKTLTHRYCSQKPAPGATPRTRPPPGRVMGGRHCAGAHQREFLPQQKLDFCCSPSSQFGHHGKMLFMERAVRASARHRLQSWQRRRPELYIKITASCGNAAASPEVDSGGFFALGAYTLAKARCFIASLCSTYRWVVVGPSCLGHTAMSSTSIPTAADVSPRCGCECATALFM